MSAPSADAARVRLQLLPPSARQASPGIQAELAYAPVVAHEHLAPDLWMITLQAPGMASRAQPGQFVMMTIAREEELAPVLPRPMALYAWDETAGTIQIVYRVVGEGTRLLTTWRPGERMPLVGPLGRGFALRSDARSILLLGRGVGICSLTALATAAVHRGVDVHAVASARHAQAMIGSELFRRVGVRTLLEVLDTDGSSDVDRLRPRLEQLARERSVQQVFVCGSNRLLRLGADLGRQWEASVQVSLEARMACGLGYCHGCSTGQVGLPEEAPLVCKDGPVFACEEVRTA